jgi:hypothetical protein
MAQKGVLLKAIQKLEYNTMLLNKELANVGRGSKRGKEIVANIARNDSMILDFKFRLTNE